MKKFLMVPMLFILAVIPIISACTPDTASVSDSGDEEWIMYTDSRYINDWCLDWKGTLWLATNGGVVMQSTGSGVYTKYTLMDGLPGNWVKTVLEDDHGNLWFGTSGGLCIWDGFSFQTVSATAELSENMVRISYKDNDGNLWFGTDGGLSCFDGREWTLYTNPEAELAQDIYQDREGIYWITTLMKGIIRFDGTNWSIAYDITESNIYGIGPIFQDSNNHFWVSTSSKGIIIFDGESWRRLTEKDGLVDDATGNIIEDKDGNIWICTGSGLNRFNGEEWETFTTMEGLTANRITAIFEDEEGNVWIGASSSRQSGVSCFDGTNWKTWIFDGDDRIESIIQDIYGKIWFQMNGFNMDKGQYGELKRYDPDTGIWDSLTSENEPAGYVVKLFRDSNGNEWAGSYSSGISHFDGDSWRNIIPDEGMRGLEITDIIEDKEGGIWFSMLDPFGHCSGDDIPFIPGRGAARYHSGEWDYFLDEKWVWDMYTADDGTIWFGTHSGVKRYDGTVWQSYPTDDGLTANPTGCIMQDDRGRFWFGTSGGISVFDGKKSIRYTVEDGLVGDFVTCIIQSEYSDMWIGTSAGVSRYDGRNWQNFTMDNGLKGEYINTILEDAKGRIWFATDGGISIFDNDEWYSIPRFGLDTCEVRDICFDTEGSVWIAASEGLLYYRNPSPDKWSEE